MTPRRARAVVAVSGVVVAAAAAAALWVFGGPEAQRRADRDAMRLDALSRLAAALNCHAEAGAAPSAPARAGEITAACLAPSEAARLVDPLTGAPYALDYPEPGVVRLCAGFEGAEPLPWAPPGFDSATGCLTERLAAPPSPFSPARR